MAEPPIQLNPLLSDGDDACLALISGLPPTGPSQHGGYYDMPTVPRGSISRVPVGSKLPRRSSTMAASKEPPTALLPVADTPPVHTSDEHTNSSSSIYALPANSVTTGAREEGSDTTRLNASQASFDNADVADDDFGDQAFQTRYARPPSYCSSRKEIHLPRRSWLFSTIIALSIYSTVTSGLWLVVAIIQPRWGHKISSGSGLNPSTASLVTAIIAKTTEISFVTIFIACVGQSLSRRAIARKSKGMTLAEMVMRNWIIQPGSLITRFEMVPYTGLTLLGALCLIATVAATLYTTASDAMVSPKLKSGRENRELSAYIRTSYANAGYIAQSLGSVLSAQDPVGARQLRIDLQLSMQSSRDLVAFLSAWGGLEANGTADNLSGRPSGNTLLFDNTTMMGTWIETEHSNVTALFVKYDRIINNVTLAIPHPGVYNAAISKNNDIVQPSDLARGGEYAIQAGTVSPSINVMCVNLAKDELAPLVYTEWPDAEVEKTGAGGQRIGKPDWENSVPGPMNELGQENFLNSTVVDNIFKWGPEYERRPPVFQLYPIDYNIITNSTVYMSDAIYIMGKNPAFKNYTLCEMRSWLSPACSTRFSVTGKAAPVLRAHCEDPDDQSQYSRSFPGDQQWPPPSMDWKWVASEWQLSTELYAGASNGNKTVARMLTQFSLSLPELSRYLPSMAEAVAAYAASTLALSASDAPFRHYLPYTKPGNVLAAPGVLDSFRALIIAEQYTSGHISDWHNIFYVVLALVFTLSVFCLLYFTLHSGLVTDFTDPQNQFALALNSPPSLQLKGSCGAGPETLDLLVPWRVAYAPSVNHYFFEEANDGPWKKKASKKVSSKAKKKRDGNASGYSSLSVGRAWL